MTNSIFIFNVVVTDIELNTFNEKDLKKLLVDVNFNNVVIPISASRINLHDLKPEYEVGFKLDVMQIRHSLRHGLPISVKYNLKLLAIGYIHFDEDVVAEICAGMDKMVLDKCCLFEGHGRVIGILGVKCSLSLKFNDTAQVIGKESPHSQDILFKANQSLRQELGNPNNNIYADPVEDPEHWEFGVQTFAREDVWATPHKPSLYYNPIGHAISCELKKMAVENDKAANSLMIGSDQQEPSEKLHRMPRNLRRVDGENDDDLKVLYAKALNETQRSLMESSPLTICSHCNCERKCVDFHKRDLIDSQQNRHTLHYMVQQCKKSVQLKGSHVIYSSVLSEQKSSVNNDSIEINGPKAESRSIMPNLSADGSNLIQNDSAQGSGTTSTQLATTHLPVATFLKFMLRETRGTENFKKVKKLLKAEYQPVINLCKRKRDLFITLRSHRYADTKIEPISFKLVKNNRGEAFSEIKKIFKDSGFCKCTCRKPIHLCDCHNIFEKTCIEEFLQNECKRRGLPMDHFMLSDSSDSNPEKDFNVDFLPPVCPDTTQPQLAPSPMNRKAIEIDLSSKPMEARSGGACQITVVPEARPKIDSMRSVGHARQEHRATGNIFEYRERKNHPQSEPFHSRMRRFLTGQRG